MSDHHSGQWHLAPKCVNLRDLLVKEGFLQHSSASARAVLKAMKRIARKHGLPEMKTLNGYVFRIMARLNRNPNRTGIVEFRP